LLYLSNLPEYTPVLKTELAVHLLHERFERNAYFMRLAFRLRCHMCVVLALETSEQFRY
jgi:hypothetical protein